MERRHVNSARAATLPVAIGGILFGAALILFGSIFGVAAPDPLQPASVVPPAEFQNGKIAFSSNPLTFESTYEVYVMDSSGSNKTQLTFRGSSMVDSARPKWSPDGTKIVFQKQFFIPPNFPPNSYVYTMNANGSSQVSLTPGSGSTLDSSPAWSPDATKIVFESGRDGNSEIYVMNANGSSPTNLTHNAAGDFSAAWSPDGGQIAFASARDGNTEIYVMNADGSNQTRLTNNTTGDELPAWSPDGSKITFSSQRDGNREIYVMDANGSNQINLTFNAANDTDPAWSPDGAKILFTSTRDGNIEIYSMNTDGSNPTRITNNTLPDRQPNWQPVFVSPSPTPTPTPTLPPSPTPTIPPPTPTPAPTPVVSAPVFSIDVFDFAVHDQPVTATLVDPSLNYIGFQADMVFNSAIAAPTPGNNPVAPAGVTANGWQVNGTVINSGPGNLKTLRISAFSQDGITPLSGAGPLYVIHWKRTSCCPASTALTWQPYPNDFEFIDGDLNPLSPPQNNGAITITAGTPVESPTPTPVSVSGTIRYCTNPTPVPVPNVTVTVTGAPSGSTTSNGAGAYQTFLPPNQGYTITPTKTSLSPGSSGIDTVDVVAVQRHALNIAFLPPGCRLTAADVNGDNSVNTVDVIAIQRFLLNMTTGLANVGKYQFSPASRNYFPLTVTQANQDYDAVIFGDVASPFVSP